MPVLQTFHREIEQIESIKRVVQFPKLEPPPADFLVQMENYAREAPRSLDDVQSQKVLTCSLLSLLAESTCAGLWLLLLFSGIDRARQWKEGDV